MMETGIKIFTQEDTIRLAEELSKVFKTGDVVVLNGDLGTGKTFFVKQFAKLFGITSVNSPTFAIVNVYTGKIKINHFDFYRINSINELHDIGFEDYINEEDAVTFIEWGNLFEGILPLNRYEIEITFDENLDREIKIKKLENG